MRSSKTPLFDEVWIVSNGNISRRSRAWAACKGMRVIGGIYQGECYPEKKNYVYVDDRIPDGYESDPEQTPAYFERTLLHEVVHWGRFMAGKSADIDGKEAGSWFEHLAYNIPYQYHSGIKCSNGDE